MRRKERAVTDRAVIQTLLTECEVMRVAFQDEPFPYIVPVNFAFEWQGDQLCLYFHGAPVGKKITLLQRDPHVAVEMDQRHQLISGGNVGCHYSYAYRSLLGFGTAELVETTAQKRHGLHLLLAQLTQRDQFELPEKMLAKTAVIKINLVEFTVKENQAR
ncbi:pyridoxamine 5'-phosphate oxidase family protein [Enterococcus sp. CSURQ0835]|uniref:pyridoxamine 5'-phosphate oxidase family protein n=1 Tax=Enterococcus sp. CSURQ0835 TaxID=2681394 RepID=UPI00135C0CC7|nr:pyridoxamine 5'-phosphate oxidase family protein [Enterococcus sp. CSURQ0835]